jgi:digeranylgeranylglycerophospholipid reductase
MKTLKYDVVVVGAGPGGSMTAWNAAKGGAKVLLLEKRQEIGSPIRCGEGMAKIWLNELGLKPDKSWIAHEVEGARIFAPDGSCLTVNEKLAGNECGYVINRDDFDQYLAFEAARAGADIMVKTMATSVMKEGNKVVGVKARSGLEDLEIQAKITIGADGFESQIGRWAGIDTNLKLRDLNSCFEYVMVDIECDPRYNDFYLGSAAPGGYVWVFPKGKDLGNVGIGVNRSKMKKGGEAKMYLDKWIQNHPGIDKGKRVEKIAGAISCNMPIDKTVDNGIMLVGDAARQIDPLTGGGIATSCQAGQIAGRVCAEAVKANDFSEKFLIRYDKEWRKKFENKLIRNYVAKEKLIDLSDDIFNKAVKALSETTLEKITTFEILKALERKYPELVKELEELLSGP